MNDKNGLPTGKHTLVEEGTEFTGKMSSSCPIVVMGKVEGDVAGPSIHVTQSGVIAGTVKVKELRSAGEVAGNVEADSVRLSGRVRDRTVIKARSLEVALTSDKGAMQVTFGECELAVGDEPNKEASIAAATAAPGSMQAAVEKKLEQMPRGRRPSENWTADSEAQAGEERTKRKTLPPPA